MADEIPQIQQDPTPVEASEPIPKEEPSFFSTVKAGVKSFIKQVASSVEEDKLRDVDKYQSDRLNATKALPKVQEALSQVPKMLEQFSVQPETPDKVKALQGVYDYVAQLKHAEAQLVGLAQPRTQAQLLEKRLNTIIQAYDEKNQKGVMPNWYTDRNFEDHEISMFKRVQAAIKDFKGAYQAQEILASSGVDKDLDLPLAPNPADEEVNSVMSGVEWLFSNTVGRLSSTVAHLALGSPLVGAVPMTDRALVKQEPTAEALINERDAALAKGDAKTASAVQGRITAQKLKQKALTAATNLGTAWEILTSTPAELKQTKKEVLYPNFYKEVVFKNLGEESPDYTFFRPVNKLSENIKAANTKDEEWLSKAGPALEQIRQQPPIYENKNPQMQKFRGDEFELPPKSKQEELHEAIEETLTRVSTRNAVDSMLHTDVTAIPQFIAEWEMQTPIFKGLQGGASLLGRAGKAFSKEALILGKAKAIAKFGDNASLVNKFDNALKVINGETKLLEIPTIQAIYTAFGNKVRGLAGGDEVLYNTVKDLRATTDKNYHIIVDEIAAGHKKFPETTTKANQKLTQVGLTNIRDSMNQEIIGIDASLSQYIKVETSRAALWRLQKDAKEGMTALVTTIRDAGYRVEKSAMTSTPQIIIKADGTRVLQFPKQWPTGMDETAKFEVLLSEWGHTKQVADKSPAYIKYKLAHQELMNLVTPMGFATKAKNNLDPKKVEAALLSLDPKSQLNAKVVINKLPEYHASKLAMEDESHQLGFQSFTSFIRPGSKLSPELPSIKQARAAALGTYQNTAEMMASPEALLRARGRSIPAPKFDVGTANTEFLEKTARGRWMTEYANTGYDLSRTSANLGINIDNIDYTKLIGDESYLRGIDILKKTGKDKAIVEGILNHPDLALPEGNKHVIRNYLDLYQRLGEINKEAGAVDLVYYGYSPRDIKQSQNLMQALLRDRKPAGVQLGKAVKYPTYAHMEEVYKRLGFELNSMSLEVAASYAQKTAANISIDKFRKFIKESQDLSPDQYGEGLKRLEKFIATGRPFEQGEGTRLWNKYVMTPMKRALLSGFPQTQMRNIGDDAFRTALANGASTLKAKSLKEAYYAYSGAATERINLGAGHSYTGEELSKIMSALGVTKSEIIAGDGIVTSGARLVKQKVAGPIAKGVRTAWEASPWAPELSRHTNNLQRSNVFIHEMRNLLKQGKPFQEAAWEARNKVGTYLIDYADTSLATDFVAEYIPFFRFYGQSLNTMIDVAMQKPWAFGKLNTFLFNSSFKAPTEEERKYLTPYLKEMTLMSMGHDKMGNRQYLSQLGLSYEIINQFLSTDGVERNIEKWVSQAPVFQFLYGIISDRHPFFGTPYNSYMGRKGEKLVYDMTRKSDWFNKAVGGMTAYPDGKDPAGKTLLRYEYNDPKRAYILLNPVLTLSSIAAYNSLKGFAGETVGAILSGQMSTRGLATWSKLTDPNKEDVVKFLNYMTGLKFISVDENAGKLGTELDKLSEQAKILMNSQRKLLDVQSKWSTPEDQALLERTLKDLKSKTAKELEEVEKY